MHSSRFSPGLVAASLLGAVAVSGQAPTPPIESASFAVFALSRGKGVPAEARELLRKVGEIVEEDKRRGIRVETRRTRFGLEGETKLCVEYQRLPDARAALERVEKLAKDVELVNVVAGPCAESPAPQEKEEP